MFNCKILADSIAENGSRLSTLEVTYPRFIHSELLTHRMFSKNSASSRAIPAKKMLENVKNNPVIPIHWGKNEPGMVANTEVDDSLKETVLRTWLSARDSAVEYAESLTNLGLHKQLVNRILEPWMWITIILSSTSWNHFFKLRCHSDAEPHIQKMAGMVRNQLNLSAPKLVKEGDWHLPLMMDDDPKMDLETKKMVSVARCARVSYLTHDGKRDISKDIELYQKLRSSGHFSPFEHVATPSDNQGEWANFTGWKQLRRDIPNEYII